MEDISLEQLNEFYEWLQNKKTPEGMKIAEGHQPDLSEDQAFCVIWFLQEHLSVLPSKCEQCQKCGNLYNSWESGYTGEHYRDGDYKESGFWCNSCIPHDVKPI